MTIVSPAARFELPAHACISEPELSFHPLRADDRNTHPLKGLDSFGPYSRSIMGAVSDPIRIAIVGPREAESEIGRIVSALESTAVPNERPAYLIEYRGFSAVFGTRLVLGDASTTVNIADDADKLISDSEAPHSLLAEQLARAVNILAAQRSQFDVLLVYLPKRWEHCFVGQEGHSFDLHHFIKGLTASLGIPAQIIRGNRAMTYRCRCSVMWRLGIALYCKAGGIPWRLSHIEPDTMFVGLGYAMTYTDEGKPRFLTTCSQVFDHDGTGLEFLAYETRDMIVERGDPYLKQDDMYRVMVRSLDLYSRRHGGKPPKSVVIHKSLPFKQQEIDGCFEAFRAVDSVELYQIQEDVFWKGAHLDPPKRMGDKSSAGYACRRGSMMLLSGTEALLWTQGNSPQGARDFFKEMKGTPSPLLVRRFAGRGPLSPACRAILGLTKMDWNNDALYNRLPVTKSFASVLADTLKRMPTLAARPYSFRLFM
jgi:hypothetical protein